MTTCRALNVGAFCAALLLGSATASAQSRLRSADSLDVDNLAFFAKSEVVGPRRNALQLSVRIQNRRDSTVAVEFGACALEPRLARPAPGRSFVLLPPGSPTMRLRHADGTWGELTEACPLYLVKASIAPGAWLDSREFIRSAKTGRLLAEPRPGVYRVIARIELLGRLFDVPAGDVTIGGTGRRSLRRAL